VKPALVVLVAVAGASAAVVPALGADATVEARGDNRFVPSTVTINTGEQVTFHNAGGYHNLHFDDEAQPRNDPTQAPWTFQRRFESAGRFGFACDVHRAGGMTGTVVVVQPGQPPRLDAELLRDHFCTRRGATCRRPGIFLRVSLDTDATVSGALERRRLRRPRAGRFRPAGRVRFAASAGRRIIRLVRRSDGRRIGVGDYRLTLRARVAGRPGSPPVAVRFFVRPTTR
jgi:plastocyanin